MDLNFCMSMLEALAAVLLSEFVLSHMISFVVSHQYCYYCLLFVPIFLHIFLYELINTF